MRGQRYSRRRLIQSGAALAAGSLAFPLAGGFARAAGQLVITDQGGSSQKANIDAFYTPFETATGTKIIYSARPNLSMGQLKAMVQANHVEWDVTVLSDYLIGAAVKQGLLDKIDYSGFDKKTLGELVKGSVDPYYLGLDSYATVMGYNTKKWKGNAAPKTWADFWDVKRFPGTRSMIGFGYGPMEAALLADGVPPDKLYPIDVNRALKKLDEIKPNVTVWTSSSAQQTQLMQNQEVDLIHGFANRMRAAIDTGAPYEVQWNQGSYQFEAWVVPKGAPNRDLAMKFLASTINPQSEATMLKTQDVGCINPKAYALIPAERAKTLPTYPDNVKHMWRVNAAWVGEHLDELTAAWTKWKTG